MTLAFIHALNDSPIVYVETDKWLIDFYGPSIPEFSFEVYSCFGEIKNFKTWKEANEWRIAEIRELLNPTEYRNWSY